MSFKIIHVPFVFHPDPIGGTEVYVANLAKELQTCGMEVVIAAPGRETATYVHDGLLVRRYAISPRVTDLSDQYGEGDLRAAREFGAILDAERPHIVHQHAFTRAVSLRVMREAKRRGIPVVFTYHTPAVSCQRETLLLWGKNVCEGLLNLGTCTRCTLNGLGAPRPIANAVSRVPESLSIAIGSAHLSGRVWTALRMREMVALRHASFRALVNEVDHMLVFCQWTKDLLERNSVPRDKITLIPHGLSPVAESDERALNRKGLNDTVLRLASLGRWDPIKGFDVLVQALNQLPDASIQLDIYGITQEQGGLDYLHYLKSLAQGDTRIRILPPLPRSRVISVLKEYDMLAVPSQSLETGPLVVLEAFAAGIPVIGSNLGGIAELITDGVNGLLVTPSTVEQWRSMLALVMYQPDLVERLKASICPPRSMATVAGEILDVYNQIRADS